jgi:hypothetical protein
VVNPAYKHLSDRLRIGELTVPQIISLFAGLMCGLVFALYVSPFGAYLTLFISIYLASIPMGSVLLASTTEFDLWLYIRALVADRLSDGQYVPGPGVTCEGYVIDGEVDGRTLAGQTGSPVDLGAIWDF